MKTKTKKKTRSSSKKKPSNRPKKQSPNLKRWRLPSRDQPVLRFTPYAWAKLHCFCHYGDTEIGGFGITAADDLLLIEDFVTVKQSVSVVTVAFDDEAVADFFEDQVDRGLKPQQFGRIWLHTHPGNCPNPSGTDEVTFDRVFGSCDWAVMFILARGGDTFARLRFNVGPGGDVEIPVVVDYAEPFTGSNETQWELEYAANIKPEPVFSLPKGADVPDDPDELEHWLDVFDPDIDLETLSRDERSIYNPIFENESELLP